METINAPIPWQGTPEQAKANLATHDFVTFDGVEYRCSNCDCKLWHAAALYNCMDEPPRADMTAAEFHRLSAEVIKKLQTLRK